MNIRYSILSRRQESSAKGNIASLIDIIEELTFRGPGVPENETVIAPFDGVFTALIDANDDAERMAELSADFWIVTPRVATKRIAINGRFQGRARTRLVVPLNGFPLHEAGTYSLCLQIGELFSKWDVDVKIVSERA